jgi:hypothetical protein
MGEKRGELLIGLCYQPWPVPNREEEVAAVDEVEAF